jgi:hypothetical protein
MPCLVGKYGHAGLVSLTCELNRQQMKKHLVPCPQLSEIVPIWLKGCPSKEVSTAKLFRLVPLQSPISPLLTLKLDIAAAPICFQGTADSRGLSAKVSGEKMRS